MFKNYIKLIQRNISRQPFYSALNICGLTFGIAGTLLIAMYVDFELNYDNIHSKRDRIYRVATTTIKTKEREIDAGWTSTPAPLVPTAAAEYSGIESYVRIYKFWVSENVKFQTGNNTYEENDV